MSVAEYQKYAEVRVEVAGRRARVPVRTRDATVPQRLNFTNQILPVITRAGCNQGSCHGKASGQGGFKLSVLAFDPGCGPLERPGWA